MPIEFLRVEAALLPSRFRLAWWFLSGGRGRIDGQIADAKAAGYPFEASMLDRESIPDEENGFVALGSEFSRSEFGWIKELSDQKETAWSIEHPTLQQNTKLFIEKSRIVGSRTKFDSKRDFDQSFTPKFPEYDQMRSVMRALCFDAGHQAKFGTSSAALESLSLAKNVVQQLSGESRLLGMIVYCSLHVFYYKAIANVAYLLRSEPCLKRELLQLVDADFPDPNFEMMMKCEFYGYLAWLRNTNGYPRLRSNKFEDWHKWFEPFDSSSTVRIGIPTSIQGQFLLSELLRNIRKVERVVRPKDGWELGLAEWDSYVERPAFCFPNIQNINISGVGTQAFLAMKKRHVWRELARFAVETCFSHPNIPSDVAPRSDTTLGGTLRYKRVGRQMCFYSTGENREDEGSPWLDNGTGNPMRIDDFGMLVPEQNPSPPNLEAFSDSYTVNIDKLRSK